ncbi:hypothetical protein JZU46_00935 [bacterium]|nr:hypothetical protein [bacterium]
MKIDKEKKEFGAWWMWLLCLVIVTSIAFGFLNSVGLIGRTIVEREVFTRSQQYTEARKTEIATFEAQLVEIERLLRNPTTTPDMKANLEASAAGLRVQLSVARSK